MVPRAAYRAGTTVVFPSTGCEPTGGTRPAQSAQHGRRTSVSTSYCYTRDRAIGCGYGRYRIGTPTSCAGVPPGVACHDGPAHAY